MAKGQLVLVGVAFGWLFGCGFTALAWHSDVGDMRRQMARGEIACEYYRSELICWNPKEEEK
jgi:hypothetical protein